MYIPDPQGGFAIPLASSAFTSYCGEDSYKVCGSRQELGVKSEIQPLQHQEECSGSGQTLRLDPSAAASHRIMVRLKLRSDFSHNCKDSDLVSIQDTLHRDA